MSNSRNRTQFRLTVPPELAHLVTGIMIDDKGSIAIAFVEPRLLRRVSDKGITITNVPHVVTDLHLSLDDTHQGQTFLRGRGSVIDMGSALAEPVCDGCGRLNCTGCGR